MNEETKTKQETDVEALLREAERRSEIWRDVSDPRDLVLWSEGRLLARIASALRAERAKQDPTRAETPEAKRDDVEALLAEADRWHQRDLVGGDLAARLARALRASQQRCQGLRAVCDDIDQHSAKALAHLQAVLAHGWPDGTTAPACVREARDFLAGKSTDGAARRADELLTAAGVHEDELSRRIEALVLDRDKAQTEAQRIRADLATLNKLHEEALRERDKLEAALSSERDRHAKTEEDRRAAVRGFNAASEERVELRAKLQAEEEAHANTKAELATERAKLREIFDAFEFTLGDPSRPEHVALVVAEAKKQCRLQDTVNALETRLANITRNPFAYITPKNEAERGILESVRAAVKGNSGNGAAMIFDLLVHATRVAGERADQLARLAAADEKSFADLAVMAERSWKEQAPFASVKIAFEWGFVRGAQAILGEPVYAAKGGA